MAEKTYTNVELAELIEQGDLADWRVLQFPLYTRYDTGDFATALKLVDAIGAAAEEMQHHPDIDLRYGAVRVSLVSHDVGGRTDRDVELAKKISGFASELGVRADLESLTLVEHGIDTWDVPEILPFWRAVYGVPETEGKAEAIDPSGFVPTIWFQRTDRHETPRQRWHPDVWVAPEQRQPRIDAALAAGGSLEDDSEPSFTVLADPQGNRVCLCVSTGR